MSETLLGVIIGGLLVIIGNWVTAWFSKRQTQIQITARQEEQLRQFEYEKEQARIARLIELQKTYLLPLREYLKNLAEQSYEAINKVRQLAIQFGNRPSLTQQYSFLSVFGVKAQGYLEGMKQLQQMAEELKGQRVQLVSLRSMVTDQELADLLDKLESLILEIPWQLLVIRSKEPAKWVENLKGEDKELDFKVDWVPLKESIIALSENLRNVNKRIEELLSGETVKK